MFSRTRLRAAVVIAGVLGALLAPAAQSSAAPVKPGPAKNAPAGLAVWKLQNEKTFMALNVGFDQGTTANNAPLRQWWNRPSDWNNQWLQKPLGAGVFTYRNRWSNQCMTVSTLEPHAVVKQLPCAEDDPAFAYLAQRQKWTWDVFATINGYKHSRIISVVARDQGLFKVLTVQPPVEGAGSIVGLDSYTGASSQHWRWVGMGTS